MGTVGRLAHRTSLYARDWSLGGHGSCRQCRYLTLLPSLGLALIKAQGIPVYAHEVVDRVDRVVEMTQKMRAPYTVEADLVTKDHTRGVFSSGLAGTSYSAANQDELENFSNQMILRAFSGPSTKFRQTCRKVLITGKQPRRVERTLSIFVDRRTLKPSIFVHRAQHGLMAGLRNVRNLLTRSISQNQIAQTDVVEWQIVRPFDLEQGLGHDDTRRLTQELGLAPDHLQQGTEILSQLCEAWSALDGNRFDITIAVTEDDEGIVRLCCTRADLSFDQFALRRQPELAALFARDEQRSQIDPRSAAASSLGMVYHKLDGDIGCFGYGAGNAMATMDIIAAYGGKPGNFLDGGGGATHENVALGLKLMRDDKSLNGIFLNCFGGITRMEIIAEGILENVQEQGRLRIPLVIRLQGTNYKEAKQMLADSRLDFPIVDDVQEAARLVVREAQRHASTPRLERIRGTRNPGLPVRGLRTPSSTVPTPVTLAV